MEKIQQMPADVYLNELRTLKARERLLEMRLEFVNKQILEITDLLQEAENNHG